MASDAVGLLALDKPEDQTSHDMVKRVRRLLGQRRVGHTGTLDPFASGLLLMCLGWATRLAEYVTALPKTYVAVIRLGVRTDTDDRTGEVVERNEGWRALDDVQVSRALARQVGEIQQRPPVYSAKKVDGRRAYAAARRGRPLELDPHPVSVYGITLRSLALPEAEIEVSCSAGTYIRAIARDVGSELGVGGHLTRLRRLRIGDFSVDEARSLTPGTSARDVLARLQPPEEAVRHLPHVAPTAAEIGELLQGRSVPWPGDEVVGPVAVMVGDRLVAIGQQQNDRLWPRKVFEGGR
jgi:tRNA pseudouridine55 synthase